MKRDKKSNILIEEIILISRNSNRPLQLEIGVGSSGDLFHLPYQGKWFNSYPKHLLGV